MTTRWMDTLPVVSQCKSAFQAVCGDLKGARKTQERFLKTCPVVSQGTSAVQALMGDTEGARETQLEFVGFVNDTVDSIPVVGHVKGGIYYVCGDTEGGDKAMKSSSRTTGVIGGGVVSRVRCRRSSRSPRWRSCRRLARGWPNHGY